MEVALSPLTSSVASSTTSASTEVDVEASLPPQDVLHRFEDVTVKDILTQLAIESSGSVLTNVYFYCVITGLLFIPSTFKSKSFPIRRIYLLQLWYAILHLLVIGTMLAFLVASFVLGSILKDGITLLVVESQYLGIFLQNLLLYPSLYTIRKSMMRIESKASLPYYNESIRYALGRSKRLFVFFTCLSCLSLVENVERQGVSSVLVFILCLFPNNMVLAGIFGYLIMEQRVSGHVMQWTLSKIVDQSLSDGDYRRTRASINARGKFQHINWLVIGGSVGVVVTFILLLAISFTPDIPYSQKFDVVIFTIANYGREIAVLLFFLWEVGLVNDVYRQMLVTIANTEAVDGQALSRVNLYIAMKELPMGTTVLHYRPSKRDIYWHIVSTLFAIFVAFLKAVTNV